MKSRQLGFAIAALIFALDQLTKWWVTGPLALREAGVIYLLPFFSSPTPRITESSLGLLNATNPVGRWMLVALTSGIALGVAYWIGKEKNRFDQAALGLVLGGALGNILDRTRFGYVIDFADLHFGDFPPFLVFNVGDAAIRHRRRDSCCCVRSSLVRSPQRVRNPGRLSNMHKALTAVVIVAAVATSGCSLLRGRSSTPDEFAVARNAPLIIPPDFSLTPRSPGPRASAPATPQSQATTPCSAVRRRAARPKQRARAGGPRTGPARNPLERLGSGHARGRQGRNHALQILGAQVGDSNIASAQAGR